MFQSAPRCGHRGDISSFVFMLGPRGFNPRPGADTGATHLADSTSASEFCFNPRPGADTGATVEHSRI